VRRVKRRGDRDALRRFKQKFERLKSLFMPWLLRRQKLRGAFTNTSREGFRIAST